MDESQTPRSLVCEPRARLSGMLQPSRLGKELRRLLELRQAEPPLNPSAPIQWYYFSDSNQMLKPIKWYLQGFEDFGGGINLLFQNEPPWIYYAQEGL